MTSSVQGSRALLRLLYQKSTDPVYSCSIIEDHLRLTLEDWAKEAVDCTLIGQNGSEIQRPYVLRLRLYHFRHQVGTGFAVLSRWRSLTSGLFIWCRDQDSIRFASNSRLHQWKDKRWMVTCNIHKFLETHTDNAQGWCLRAAEIYNGVSKSGIGSQTIPSWIKSTNIMDWCSLYWPKWVEQRAADPDSKYGSNILSGQPSIYLVRTRSRQ